jgi:prephenate dehydratase
MKIAIQGIKGSYHDQVAAQLYKKVSLQECTSFDLVAIAVANKEVDRGIMAIGNSIAGSILPNYNLIKDYNLQIVGEYHLYINHKLMALPGQKINDIKEVHSHPMALLQCTSFFKNHPHVQLLETDDTAAAAYRIFRDQKQGVAAIASAHAAQLYHLNIINDQIQEITNNATRFVIVTAAPTSITNTNKATIYFTAGHHPGSLAKILTKIAGLKINVSKIQSVPIIEQAFVFSFVADLEFEQQSQFDEVLLEIGLLVESLQVLGIYKSHTL